MMPMRRTKKRRHTNINLRDPPSRAHIREVRTPQNGGEQTGLIGVTCKKKSRKVSWLQDMQGRGGTIGNGTFKTRKKESTSLKNRQEDTEAPAGGVEKACKCQKKNAVLKRKGGARGLAKEITKAREPPRESFARKTPVCLWVGTKLSNNNTGVGSQPWRGLRERSLGERK